jgi:hypothetical protein
VSLQFVKFCCLSRYIFINYWISWYQIIGILNYAKKHSEGDNESFLYLSPNFIFFSNSSIQQFWFCHHKQLVVKRRNPFGGLKFNTSCVFILDSFYISSPWRLGLQEYIAFISFREYNSGTTQWGPIGLHSAMKSNQNYFDFSGEGRGLLSPPPTGVLDFITSEHS